MHPGHKATRSLTISARFSKSRQMCLFSQPLPASCVHLHLPIPLRWTITLIHEKSGLTNSNPDFGHGVVGYARYLGTSYADFVIGDYMTEAILPSLLHQDPRYFRKSVGGSWARLGYACEQVFVTHNDSGTAAFNYSEIIGNSAAVAISTAYYANNRNAADATVKLTTQVGVDMAANILKEFWPDLNRKLSQKH